MCSGVVYSGENDICDVNLSLYGLYPHLAGSKSLPECLTTAGIEPTPPFEC